MGHKKSRSFDETSARGRDEPLEPAPGVHLWPWPVSAREWVGAEGTAWRMRGGLLNAKQARRLMKRPGVQVVWAYGLEVASAGAERDALLARVEEFFAGNAPAHSDFWLGDFRDQSHRVVLMVEESC